ncbi:hypothetical protein A2276_02455 [candidate division WOR-1 bacterium RIFOXYA12_FULL_43_27]|uniref:Undecaprenyl-phosphate alpha-N-acetylglucosaminyl 1-phosphate transferase n=1 Tax=candidate division WOR-1 bacterium RIFOXYC2_FULL_46_14 TaxID=1802587 RepID=A0A1F4U7U2_UNCSA|nr:MAG: hypothetical protein A2276_02455 [candidate division WOR-1 bacterium RIFOXYA12_FULL_43_27]OGC19427.1 MAG: hypothetical protein A2292_01875 [candidate division WOR-1 bacterium RIFOXYB2_FULL_46_45]OGC30416.1 MAG: hypothetical protein A2232_01875 [candidate division WOR-1 bacterium RIFOXYA2_FULL_46_56]OGC41016.1 MAG: hypothetical protein A2438_01875 [candidate division WOR-1 bacterium RIFOXYC2_FULL_46_14]
MLLFPISFLTAFLLTILATPAAIKLAFKIGAVDTPNQRKIHTDTIPRLGGIAIFFGFFSALILGLIIAFFSGSKLNLLPIFGITLGSIIIVLLGIKDDMKSLKPSTKFFWQIVAATVAYGFGVSVSFMTNPFNGLMAIPMIISFPLTLLWIVGVTNAINLIDGLDGLAAGVTAISASILFFVALRTHQIGAALTMLCLAGAALGFLRYNFFPAKIFLGDSGSLLLGFVLATSSIIGVFKTTLVVALIIPLLILGVPIFDTLFAIGRRMKEGQPVFKADNKHIHHMLLRAGFTQREAVLSIYIVCFLLGLSALVMVLFK